MHILQNDSTDTLCGVTVYRAWVEVEAPKFEDICRRCMNQIKKLRKAESKMADEAHTIVKMGDDGVLHVGADRPGVAAVTSPVADVQGFIQDVAEAAGLTVAFLQPGDRVVSGDA